MSNATNTFISKHSLPIYEAQKDDEYWNLVETTAPDNGFPRTTGCGHNCITCDHISSDPVIVSYVMKKSFCCNTTAIQLNCNTANLVYIITCIVCGMQYVGQTRQKLRDRFRKHRLDVLNKHKDTCLVRHFNSNGHSIHDMKVCIIQQLSDEHTTKLLE
ncbi:MAG: GIY-YIG nuclease family protein, partial [bacterium]|nr:GIY-YIG nuclease family protein [bacterium]